MEVFLFFPRPGDADKSLSTPVFDDPPPPNLLQPPAPPLSTEEPLESQELQLSAALKLKNICLQSTLVATLKVQYLVRLLVNKGSLIYRWEKSQGLEFDLSGSASCWSGPLIFLLQHPRNVFLFRCSVIARKTPIQRIM